jgi:hypothetical protein
MSASERVLGEQPDVATRKSTAISAVRTVSFI